MNKRDEDITRLRGSSCDNTADLELDSVHVPMSPLGKDRCAGVQSRTTWNSPE